MARLDDDLTRRRVGVALLAGTSWASPALHDRTIRDRPLPLLRVPLLVRDRDALLERLVGHGVVSGYVYDPPLDDHAGAEFVEPSPAPSAARWFSSHVLPADSLLAREITSTLTRERAKTARPSIVAQDPATAPQKPLDQ